MAGPSLSTLLFRKQFLDLRLIALSQVSQGDLGLLVVDRVRKSEAAVQLLIERQDLVGPYVTIFGHASFDTVAPRPRPPGAG
jgi:hypothetical protein